MLPDILIRNGQIYDGTGNPPFFGDISITGNRISAIASSLPIDKATTIIDADGMAVSPGFIDVHSHADCTVIVDNHLPSLVHQGITTCIAGNCGESVAPISRDREKLVKSGFISLLQPLISWNTYSEYLSKMEQQQSVINFGFLVGFEQIRIGFGPAHEDREPTAGEIKTMKQALGKCMEAGALGLCTGIVFPPQVYAKTEEIAALAKTVADYGGIYASHIRDEASNVVDAVEEFIEIIEKSGCRRGNISHHKICGTANWGKSKETLKLIETANQSGLNITFDVYPYTRGGSPLSSVLPPWIHEGGTEKMVERLKFKDNHQRIKKDVQNGIEGWENRAKGIDFKQVYFSWPDSEQWQPLLGKSISEITRLKGLEDDWDTVFNLLIDSNGEVQITVEIVDEKEMIQLLQSSDAMVGSDAKGASLTGKLKIGNPHPRNFGTYPKILGQLVRDQKVLKLEDAIRKMTSFPARVFGIRNRGLLQPGYWADIVIFNKNTVIDRSTYEQPFQYPDGIQHVLINGVPVIVNSNQNDQLPGMIIRRH